MNGGPYSPGPAYAKIVAREGENWSLVLTRDMTHPPQMVWEALTDPAQLRAWAPFDADANLGKTGARVKLTTVGAPGPHVIETKITKADPPKTLEFNWGGGDLRWQLTPHGKGTRLTLWASINRKYVAMGAAGWHVCLDVLDRALGDDPIPRIVGPEAMQFEGWRRLTAEYTKQFAEENR